MKDRKAGPSSIADLRDECRCANNSTRAWVLEVFGERINKLEENSARHEGMLEALRKEIRAC